MRLKALVVLPLVAVWLTAARAEEVGSELFSTDFTGYETYDGCDGACQNKGSGKCKKCCDGCPATCWEFGVGAVVMTRDDHPGLPLVLDLDATDIDLFNAEDFNMGWKGGPNFWGILHGPGCNDLHFNFFSIDEFNDSVNITPTTGTPPYTLTFAPGTYNGFRATYRSELQSFEVNGRRECSDRIALLAGFRYLNIDEYFAMRADGTAGTPDLLGQIETKNNLYGLQLGLDTRLLRWGCFTVDGLFRAGVAGNDATQICRITNKPTTQGSVDRGSFLGEMIFRGKYCLGDHLSAYGGYQLLWVTGLALAPQQLTLGAQNGIVATDTIFYHGANFGIEFRR